MTHFHLFDPHRVRKTHYRRCVALLICTGAVAHHYIPDHEWWVGLVTNLIWLYDPTEV